MSKLYGVPLPEAAAAILQEILDSVQIPSCQVTSVARTPEAQARVMWENLSAPLPPSLKVLYKDSVARYLKLYKAPGQAVIRCYQANAPLGRDRCIEAMTAEIYAQGPSKVSAHCQPADGDRWVFDIAPSSIPQFLGQKFCAAARKHPRVVKVLQPPVDPAFHLEVNK